jgi:outer membrane receptor protein involved in Fe transport
MTRRIAFLSFAVAAAGLPAAAQVPVKIPPVEVVATRLPEAPHDVAASIEVISGTDLRARGVTTLREALALAAGVAIAPGGDAGPAGGVPEFWGLREFDAFLLVVDGIPWGGAFNPAIPTLSLRDVERIEVLRGPAPVTYGATSFVGVIHVVHSPAAATARYFSANGGTFGTGGAAIDLPAWSRGAWNSRLSADVQREGFKDDRTQYTKAHGLLRLGRTDGPRATWLTDDANILQQDPASPHPRQGSGLSAAVPSDANYNPAGAFLNENRVAFSAGMDRPVLSGATWGSTASYTFSSQEIFRGFLTDISNTPNNASGSREDIEINDLYADSHVIWPSKNGWTFMAGADALFANGEGRGATFTYTAPLNGSSAANVTEPTVFDKDAEALRFFAGAYASTEWRPTTRLTLSGGLRLNATTERHGEGATTTNTRPAGSVGALFSIWERGVDHLRVFANYRNTFKPAAFDFSLAENEGVLDPETSNSYEAGIKHRVMDGRLDLEASAFRMDFENLVTSTVVNGQPALINAGKTRFQGMELTADARLPMDLSARASVSFHDPKFVDYVQAFDGVPTQLGGRRFEMSARRLASAGLSLAPERGLIANVSMNYTGDRYLNKRNTALVEAFTTFDAGIGYRTTRDIELRVDARNLTDRRDAVSESEFGDAQYYLMPARTIRAGVTVRY